jgi:hypothetical protein
MQYKTKAGQIAHGLIQSYIGPDHKVIDMQRFLGELVAALRDAHEQGRSAQSRKGLHGE